MLSAATQTFVEVEAFRGEEDLRLPLSRAKMEEACAALWPRLMAPVEAALEGRSESIDHIVLVGGSTRTPKVRALLAARFPGTPITSQGIHPDEAVACGAALQAAQLAAAGRRPRPRRAGAGARARARAAPAPRRRVLLVDVTPITLGVETAGGVRTPVVPRNSTVPCRVTHRFSTYLDRQPSVRIKVLEGERSRASACHALGTFELAPIPPLPKGQPVIEVTFHVNVDGILAVSAVETSSQVSRALEVTRWNAQKASEGEHTQKDTDDDSRWMAGVRARQALEGAIFEVAQTAQSPAFRTTHARAGCDDVVKACEEARAWLSAAAGDTAADRIAEERLRRLLADAPPAPRGTGGAA